MHAHYKVELAVAGMEDGPPSALTPADRLAILRRRQAAWKTLAWTAKQDVPMRAGGVWELYGNVLAQAEGERALHFVREDAAQAERPAPGFALLDAPAHALRAVREAALVDLW